MEERAWTGTRVDDHNGKVTKARPVGQRTGAWTRVRRGNIVKAIGQSHEGQNKGKCLVVKDKGKKEAARGRAIGARS